MVNEPKPLTDVDKWEIDIAFGNYDYANDDIKNILEKVSEKIIIFEKVLISKLIKP